MSTYRANDTKNKLKMKKTHISSMKNTSISKFSNANNRRDQQRLNFEAVSQSVNSRNAVGLKEDMADFCNWHFREFLHCAGGIFKFQNGNSRSPYFRPHVKFIVSYFACAQSQSVFVTCLGLKIEFVYPRPPLEAWLTTDYNNR